MGVLHLAIRNKCIRTPAFLQLSLAPNITLLGKKKYIQLASCYASLSNILSCRIFHLFTPIFFYAIREILYTYNPIYQYFTLG